MYKLTLLMLLIAGCKDKASVAETDKNKRSNIKPGKNVSKPIAQTPEIVEGASKKEDKIDDINGAGKITDPNGSEQPVSLIEEPSSGNVAGDNNKEDSNQGPSLDSSNDESDNNDKPTEQSQEEKVAPTSNEIEAPVQETTTEQGSDSSLESVDTINDPHEVVDPHTNILVAPIEPEAVFQATAGPRQDDSEPTENTSDANQSSETPVKSDDLNEGGTNSQPSSKNDGTASKEQEKDSKSTQKPSRDTLKQDEDTDTAKLSGTKVGVSEGMQNSQKTMANNGNSSKKKDTVVSKAKSSRNASSTPPKQKKQSTTDQSQQKQPNKIKPNGKK